MPGYLYVSPFSFEICGEEIGKKTGGPGSWPTGMRIVNAVCRWPK
jgi:hypothetical protein